ncbi:MAG: sigma-70 family RNA polymerase sigma factor [Actinomycetota bacterium]|nr:sigma-70 family RNA polymerase sigma factor [Actinomycetota bacterium]
MLRETVSVASDVPVVEGREPFERFYGREYRRVLALAHVLTGNRSLAEELTQEAFLEAYRQWHRLANPEWWVRSVVSNHARSWLRRRYAEVRALTRLGPRREAGISEMPADTAHFWDQVRGLPRRQAQVIALVYLDDRPLREVAQILGCTESTARVHLARGRKQLATVLGVQEET